MKLKKRWDSLTAAILALCMLTIGLCADAAESVPVQPRFTAVVDMQAGLEFNWLGGAKCSGGVYLENGYTGDLTVTLQRSTNQILWDDVKTWTTSGSDIFEISKTYYVKSGYYYRVEVVVDAYNAAGAFIETVSLYSSTVYH